MKTGRKDREAVQCPYCGSENVVLYGKCMSSKKQRYMCRNAECSHKTFLLKYDKKAFQPGVREQAVNMVRNGSTTENASRVLSIAKETVDTLMKKRGC